MTIEWETPHGGRVRSGERSRPFFAAVDGDTAWVWLDGMVYRLPRTAAAGATRRQERAIGAPGATRAPLPGLVARVAVCVGDAVEPSTLVAVLSAMKMEHEIRAGCRGRVKRVLVREGARVDAGAEIVQIEPEQSAEKP